MPALESGATVELWIPTAELPKARPFGLAASHDGTTLYVGCVGSGSDGVVVAIDIATKAQTVIASGLEYVKHGMDVDSAGNLYYVTGPNPGALSTLWRWDGTTNTALWIRNSLFGMCIGEDDKVYFEQRASGGRAWYSRRHFDGTLDWTRPPAFDDGLFDQPRGMDTTSQYLIIAESDQAGLHVQNVDTGVAVRWFTALGASGAPHGLHAVSDTEVYVLTQWGQVSRYDPVANTASRVLLPDLPDGAISGLTAEGSYADIIITSLGQVFITRGGWSADDADPSPNDEAHGTDVGIYVVGSVATPGWVIGRVGPTW
jgi:sugar lactone lactonase YvrE